MKHLSKPKTVERILRQEKERRESRDRMEKDVTLDLHDLKTIYADILNPKSEFTSDKKKLMEELQK